ncbi:hydrophobic surface binding protein A-domain-containing protein [Mycena crocata]|nr:hydrophobic surface binding protein A-domain-containing protein [Mycena crocata]
MQISRILALLAVVSTGFALSIKRDTATVESDLNEITGRTKVLDDKIVNYDGTLGPALEIHSDSTNLIQKIDSSTTDVKSTGPFSETDGHTVLGQVQGLEPIIQKTVVDLIAKKESFINQAEELSTYQLPLIQQYRENLNFRQQSERVMVKTNQLLSCNQARRVEECFVTPTRREMAAQQRQSRLKVEGELETGTEVGGSKKAIRLRFDGSV